MVTKGLRAGIYVRLSVDREGETSMERQEADARSLAASKHLEVVEVYMDRGISAYKQGVTRPSYERLLDDVRAGTIDVVIVWKIDRLARSLREFMRAVDILETAGAALLSVNDSIDTSTPTGKAMLRIIGVFAELESDTISLRTKSAALYKANRGEPAGGGHRAFGYVDQSFSSILPEEATLLHEARDRLLVGGSLRSIAIDWNHRGLRTVTDAAWSSSNLGRTLRGPHLAGFRCHRGKRVAGSWTPIFTVEEHEAILLATGHHRPAMVSRHLLTGILRCGLCGSSVRGKTTERFGFQYTCGGCGRLAVNGTMAEAFVAEQVFFRLENSPDVLAALADREGGGARRALIDQLDGDRAMLEQLSRDHYVDRVIPREAYLAASRDLEQRVEETANRLARMTPTEGLFADLGQIRQRWDAAPLVQRRVVLSTMIERIDLSRTTVRGRSKFDPDRFAVIWR